MLDLQINDMWYSFEKDRVIISVSKIPCFGDDISDRFGKDAIDKAREFGKSCLDKDIKIGDTEYKIEKHDLMMGSFDYVGSVIFQIKAMQCGTD
ncbi:MAG: hypothetical protein KAS32_27745 [Candidatus Peribacteraceae bacterium]|nr:hypothetical protein [Candidatus Peribacteraceae bacterium]